MYYKVRVRPKRDKIRYAYFEEFDNWSCSLEEAYDLYDQNKLVHIFKDGVVKCYQEFKNLTEDEYQIGDLKLIDLI